MRSKRTRSSMKVPFSPDADLEKGNSFKHFQDERPLTEEPPEISEEQPPGDDDSDNNDKFWKMFQEEAAAEASWKVDIWKTELDSLLVFAGLFAAVVSAFVIDLRLHLRPDPVLLALNNIASILRNESEPPEVEHARSVVRGVGFLWYGSLVVTLIGALWGVLAKGWLGALLREPPNNPADRAMERWRRDEATKKWHMETVVTGVPLLTQIGLAMFLSGFVVQSFDDNRGIGVLVLVFVTLGVLAYAIFTLLPLFLPDCPYRTPLTNIVKPVSSAKATSLDEDIFSKIQILVSRLNRSSNDEIFTSAASVLDAKLESPDWEKWFNGVEMRAYEIAEAFSVRLKSFAHRVHTIRKGPTLSMMRDVANSPTTGGEALMGTLYSHSPMEQGITCLRVLLKSIEASINPEGDKSPWIKQDIDRHWRTSEIYPPAWRLLSLSIHITKLVAREDDYSGDDAVEIDWKTLISKTFPDLTLRSISGASACRGLLHGQPNLRRICALGLAMFIETEASSTSDSLKMLFFERDSDPGINAGKHITEKLWDELIKIWKNSAVQIVCRARNEGDAVEGFNKLLNHELYQEDIKRSIVNIISKQLDDSVWTTRKQAIQMLTKLSERSVYQEAILNSGVISKVVSKLRDRDEDVRAASIRALSIFSEKYLDVFTDAMKMESGISKLVATLTDDDADVRAAAVEALLAFAIRGGPLTPVDTPRLASIAKIYHPDIKLSIPNILKLLNYNVQTTDSFTSSTDWRVREQTVKLLVRLAELDEFQDSLRNEQIVSKFVAKLTDTDSDVRAAAVSGVVTFGTRELYKDDMKMSIPALVEQLEDTDAGIRVNAIEILVKLSERDDFRESVSDEQFISKLVRILEDDVPNVRQAAISALQTFSAQERYRADIGLSIPTIISQLQHKSWTARVDAVNMLAALSEIDAYQESLKAKDGLHELVSRLGDSDEDVRAASANALSTIGAQIYFKEKLDSEKALSALFANFNDPSAKVRSIAFRAMRSLSDHEMHANDVKNLISIPDIITRLKDEIWSTREQTVEILTLFATDANFQGAMKSEKVVFELAGMLIDEDEDVRVAVAKAFSVFGRQECFQKSIKSEKVIIKLTEELSDPFISVRDAAQATLLIFSTQGFYQNDIKSAIPNIMKNLDAKSWITRRQIIRMLAKLCERSIFQEAMKAQMVISKLVDKLTSDQDNDVVAAAANALKIFGTKSLFQDRMKSEKVIQKLVSKVSDPDNGVRQSVSEALLVLGQQAELTEFLREIILTLTAPEKTELRSSVYKVLKDMKSTTSGSRSNDNFTKTFDTVICKFLSQPQQEQDRVFICQLIAIMTDAGKEDLTGKDLRFPTSINKSSRDAVESLVRSKLVYDKNVADQFEVVLAISRLAKSNVFIGCLKPAIPGILEAINSNDQHIWNAAITAIASLSTQDEYRTELIPAVDKLIQQLNGWSQDDESPLNLVEVMYDLVLYKEFQMRLKHVVPVLMSRLENIRQDGRNDITLQNQDNDNNIDETAFYRASCKLISRLCEKDAVGKDLVPHVAHLLSQMDGSLNEDLYDLVSTLLKYARLTMNDRIALASALRISHNASDSAELQIWKLNIAALLDEARKRDHPPSDYNLFLGAVLGTGNQTVKSKLSTLVPSVGRGRDTRPELGLNGLQ